MDFDLQLLITHVVVPGEAEGDGRERGAKARVAEVGSLFLMFLCPGVNCVSLCGAYATAVKGKQG